MRYKWILLGIVLVFASGTVSLLQSKRLVSHFVPDQKSKSVPAGLNRLSFSIQNQGSAPGRILNMWKDCSCADLLLDRSLVPPGESATLTVLFHDSDQSKKTVPIRLETDSTETHQIHLHVIYDKRRSLPNFVRVIGSLVIDERTWDPANPVMGELEIESVIRRDEQADLTCESTLPELQFHSELISSVPSTKDEEITHLKHKIIASLRGSRIAHSRTGIATFRITSGPSASMRLPVFIPAVAIAETKP